MKSESMFQLKMMAINGKPVPSPIVSVGHAMVNVSGKLKNGESFQIVTPTSVAGVRGTKFDVVVANDGSTVLSVSEGSVSTRMRIHELENLPTEIQEKSVVISSVKKQLMEVSEQTIEAGQQTEITKKQTDKLLVNSGLAEPIKKMHFDTQAKLSSEEIANATQSLDKNFPKTEAETQTLSKSIQQCSSLKVEKTASNDFQSKLNEYKELIAIEKKKLESNESTTMALTERNDKNQEVLVKRIEEITGKKIETLILKSGKKVKGIIFLEGELYHVITTDGQESFKEEDIKGMEL